VSKICKKCDTLITFDDNNYCESCANELVADLEAKLAESEKKFKASKDAIKFQSEEQKEWMDKYFNTAIKLEKLEQQLAEKKKEIEDLKNNHYLIKKDYIVDYFVSQTNEPMPMPKFVTNQDKISFALEQFEKLKEKVICGVLDTSNDFWDFTLKKGDAYILDDALLDLLEQEFDNQIEELKKEMK
jgi:hypothetical protein